MVFSENSESTSSKLVAGATATSNPTQLLFQDNFEQGFSDEWIYERPNQDSVQVVDAPERIGHAVRFDLSRSEGARAEIRLAREPAGEDRWYGFKTFLPDQWQSDPSFEIIAQWQAWPDQDLGEDWRTPPLSIIVEGDSLKIHNRWDPKLITQNNDPAPEGGTATLWQGNYTKGEWIDWTFRVNWSHGADGRLQVWKDGEMIVDRLGPNTYNDREGVYFKTGLYKPHWKFANSTRSITTQRTLFVDDVRVGNGQLSLQEFSRSSEDAPASLMRSTGSQVASPQSFQEDVTSVDVADGAGGIDFGGLQSYGGAAQDRRVQVTRSPNLDALKLEGNGWKKLAINYDIRPETQLSFEFRSSSEGEIHAIGFDQNNRITQSDASKTFQLHGTQDWGLSQFDDYVTGSGWQRYQIPVGQFLTGEMNFLTFANDQDVQNPTAVSEFKNISLFEPPSSLERSPSAPISLDAHAAADTSLNSPDLNSPLSGPGTL